MKTMQSHSTINSLLLGVATLLLAASLATTSMGTAFTYEGRLNDSGSPANGLFAVTLDFGAAVFNGEARFLEIGVRPTSGSADPHAILAPRQELMPTPYAIRAQDAAMAGTVTGPVAASQITGTLAASNIGAGTITSTNLAAGAADGQAGVPSGAVVLSESENWPAGVNLYPYEALDFVAGEIEVIAPGINHDLDAPQDAFGLGLGRGIIAGDRVRKSPTKRCGLFLIGKPFQGGVRVPKSQVY